MHSPVREELDNPRTYQGSWYTILNCKNEGYFQRSTSLNHFVKTITQKHSGVFHLEDKQSMVALFSLLAE